jgi:DNA polymerase III subunit delta
VQVGIEQLPSALKRGLAPIYFISGDEPLLAQEAADQIRAAASSAGFAEREVHTVESGFDWDALYGSTRETSLFASRRLIELRLPSGKPGEAGAKTIVALTEDPSPDIVLLVIAGKLEKQARSAKWVSALERAGVAIALYPVDAARLPSWIEQRFRARNITAGPGVVDAIAHYTEGNLLACAQEIDKLALLGQSTISADDIAGTLGDSSRYTVFALADACLAGEPVAIRRILKRLRSEGEAPVLVLWALTREVRDLVRMTNAMAGGRSESAVMDDFGIWQRRKPLMTKALRRKPVGGWLGLLRFAARVDRVIKGRRPGDAWLELENLALALGGVRSGILLKSGATV